MLRLGSRYIFEVEPGRSHELQVEKELGAGQIVDVFLVRLPEWGKEYALKVPRTADNYPRVQDEFKVLDLLEKAQAQAQWVLTPTGNKLVTLYLNGQPVPGLLMEVIRHPILNDVYRDKQQAALTLSQQLENERWAWEALEQYLSLVQVMLQEGLISHDRKRDTLLWQGEHLLVIDWNVVDRNVQAYHVTEHLRLIGQLWFTLFTRLRPDIRPSEFEDAQWGNITLYSRQHIHKLMNGRYDLKQAMEVAKQANSWLAPSWETAQSALQNHQAKWQSRMTDMSPAQLQETYWSSLLRIDIVRRLPAETENSELLVAEAEALYHEIRSAMLSRVGVVDANLSKDRMYNLLLGVGRSTEDYQAIIQEIEQLLKADQLNSRSYRHTIDRIAESLRSLLPISDPQSRTELQRVQEQLRKLQEELEKYRVNPQNSFKNLFWQVELHGLVLDMVAAINLGDLETAQQHMRQVETLSPLGSNRDFLDRLGLSTETLKNLKAALSQTPNREGNLREAFLKAAISPEGLADFVARYGRADISFLPLEERLYQEHYWQYALALQIAAKEAFQEGNRADVLLIEQLGTLRRLFPQLAEVIDRSLLVRGLKAAYQQARQETEQSQNTILYPTALMRWHKLNHLLLRLYNLYPNLEQKDSSHAL